VKIKMTTLKYRKRIGKDLFAFWLIAFLFTMSPSWAQEATSGAFQLQTHSHLSGGTQQRSAGFILYSAAIGGPYAGEADNSSFQGAFGYPPTLLCGASFFVANDPVNTFSELFTRMEGIELSEAFATNVEVILVVNVEHGTLHVDDTLPGGVTSEQIAQNGSAEITITATLAQINTTLRDPSGLLYRSDLNHIGLDTLTMGIDDQGYTGGALQGETSITLVVRGSLPDEWQIQHFQMTDLSDTNQEWSVWGMSADPDHDGVHNLLEYALGLDPNDSSDLHEGVRSSLIEEEGHRYALLTFRRRTDDPHLRYIPEVSTDQHHWMSGPDQIAEVGVTPLNDSWETVTYQDLVPIRPDHPRFFRLRVVADPIIQITEIADGDIYLIGTDIWLTAETFFINTLPREVSFYINGALLQASDTAPFSTIWNPGSTGVYEIVVGVMTGRGEEVFSAPVTVTIDADTDGDSIPDLLDPRPSIPNVAPVVQRIDLNSPANFHNEGDVHIYVQSQDEDGDAIFYHYSVNGQPLDDEDVWTWPAPLVVVNK